MRIDRFGAVDSSEEADERYFELLRIRTPSDRLRMVFEHMEFGRRLREIGDEVRKAKTDDTP